MNCELVMKHLGSITSLYLKDEVGLKNGFVNMWKCNRSNHLNALYEGPHDFVLSVTMTHRVIRTRCNLQFHQQRLRLESMCEDVSNNEEEQLRLLNRNLNAWKWKQILLTFAMKVMSASDLIPCQVVFRLGTLVECFALDNWLSLVHKEFCYMWFDEEDPDRMRKGVPLCHHRQFIVEYNSAAIYMCCRCPDADSSVSRLFNLNSKTMIPPYWANVYVTKDDNLSTWLNYVFQRSKQCYPLNFDLAPPVLEVLDTVEQSLATRLKNHPTIKPIVSCASMPTEMPILLRQLTNSESNRPILTSLLNDLNTPTPTNFISKNKPEKNTSDKLTIKPNMCDNIKYPETSKFSLQ